MTTYVPIAIYLVFIVSLLSSLGTILYEKMQGAPLYWIYHVQFQPLSMHVRVSSNLKRISMKHIGFLWHS